jgi:hypothetical protein
VRVGIARWRSYASVLIIPRRKMRLCEALHRRRPWPELDFHGSSWGTHRRGEGGEGQGGAAWGRHGELLGRRHGRGCRHCSLLAASCSLLRVVRGWCLLFMRERRQQGGRRKERKKEKEEKEKKKREKYGKKFKLDNF